MQKTLLKLIPKSIRSKIFKKILSEFQASAKSTSAQIPKYELERKHIANTKILINREELLKILPKNGVVAELGVDEGGFSEMILRICTPEKMHLVDFWGSERYNQGKRKKVEDRFSQKINEKKVEINIGYSTDVVNEFQDNYFDWIYIDTDHAYKTTIAELEKYQAKVKENGIIAGHDYVTGNWDDLIRFGVIEAVSEFCVKYNWEILYLTAEKNIHPSFAIRKINTSTNKG